MVERVCYDCYRDIEHRGEQFWILAREYEDDSTCERCGSVTDELYVLETSGGW